MKITNFLHQVGELRNIRCTISVCKLLKSLDGFVQSVVLGKFLSGRRIGLKILKIFTFM